MFLALWEFDVKPGCDERLKSASGLDGDYAQLFRRDLVQQQSLTTNSLLRNTFRELTSDFWEFRKAYESCATKSAMSRPSRKIARSEQSWPSR
jgi:hypothetical protein